MSDHEQKKEIRRIRNLLQKIAELSEHAEQTGSFGSGAHNSVRRYNAIVERLEEIGAIQEDIFPQLEEDADFGQLGPESTLLADYLHDLAEEETPSERPPDIGTMIALAPFVEQREFTRLIHKHFAGMTSGAEEEERVAAVSQVPDLKTIVGLAPHIDKKMLGEMVRASLMHNKIGDPKLLVAIAPHMDSREFSQLLRDYLPAWFGAQKPDPTEEEKTVKNTSDPDWTDFSPER